MATKTKAVKKPATKKAVKKTAVKKSATTKKAATKKPATKKAATKKAVTKKAATKKPATKKPEVKTTTKRLPAGYKIKMVVRDLNLPEDIGGKDSYELYEVSGKKIDKPRVFISEKHARDFIMKTEKLYIEAKAVLGKGHAPIGMRAVATATADIIASADLEGVTGGPKSDRKESKVMYSDSE